jgi:outer membrane protein assembly factor BamB
MMGRMRWGSGVLLVSMLVFLGVVTAARAADWNQWRGPQRNGHVPDGPALLDGWSADGPKQVWVSEEKVLSGESGGGMGGVVVAKGRMYCLIVPRHSEPLTTRTLAEARLLNLGWTKTKPPEDLLAKVEKARVSDERQALKNSQEVQAWVKAWVEANLDAEAKQKHGGFISNRLARGRSALDMAVLDKLATIKDQEFPDQAALDRWLDANGIEGDARKTVLAQIPVKVDLLDNEVLCVDAGTGKTLWRRTFQNDRSTGVLAGGDYMPSSTPCVVDGKCYIMGMGCQVFCLDAVTGKTIWSAAAGTGRSARHCSFAVIDGVAVVPAGPLTGFDAQTGQVLWAHEAVANSWASPVFWQNDGKTWLVIRAGGKIMCLDPKPGTIRWSIDEGKASQNYAGSSPAIVGDVMAVSNQRGVCIYRLSAETAKRLWDVRCPMDYDTAPTIVEGHVYVFGRSGGTCISLESGEITWQDGDVKMASYSVPILADGTLLLQGFEKAGSYGDGSLCMIAVSPEKPRVLGKARIGQALCATSAVVDGLFYCRLTRGLACYDLRAVPQPPAE